MKNLLLFILPLFLLSCTKKEKLIKSERGAIDIISNIYFDASKGLEDNKQFHISKINYIGDDIIELVPDIYVPEFIDSVFYIKDTTYYEAGILEEAKTFIFKEHQLAGEPKNVFKKKYGAVWVNIPIFDYDKRKDIADTTLYENKHYKRFEINTADNYTVFYIHPTDTIMPYSLNRIAEKDYKGRIERIDSYDKKRDLFSTMWLITRKELDKEAQDIFDYNAYIQEQFDKKKKEKNY